MLTALLAALTAIPKIATAISDLSAAVTKLDQRLNEVQASNRLNEKNASVDSRIDAVIGGLPPPSI